MVVDTKKLRSIMFEQNVSQRKLAELTGVGLNHINEVINNKTYPRVDLVVRICEVLKIDDSATKAEIFLN